MEQVCNLCQRIFADSAKIANLATAEKNKKKQSAIPNKPKLVCADICRIDIRSGFPFCNTLQNGALKVP